MATFAQVQLIVDTLVPPGNFPTADSEPDFAKRVRSASVLLKQNNPVTYADIRLATYGAYNRIFLRIAAGRNTDNTFLYTADDIIEMMQPTGGSSSTEERYNIYGGALEWAGSKLVASHVLRTIPLQSNLKFVDVADNLEVQALEDVDRIIKLLSAETAASTSSVDEADQGQVTLYIAHSLNKASIPESVFNIPDSGSSPPTYEASVDLKDSVYTYDGINVPAGQRSFCYFYMTGQATDADREVVVDANDIKDSSSVSFKIEDVFEVPNGTNIDTLITLISDNINIKTLESIPTTALGNILIGPERGQDVIKPQFAIKKLLYPQTTQFKTRQATFNLCYRVNKLNFEVRRISSKVSAELLTIMFYTVDEFSWTTYDNSLQDAAAISQLRSSAQLGIEGLIFGQQNNYSTLASTSPFSVILKVEKSGVIPVSIQDTPNNNTTEDLASDGTLLPIDTYYFHAPNSFTGFSSNLLLRISSTDYASSTPTFIEVDLMTPPIQLAPGAGSGGNEWTPPNCIGEEVARRVTEAIYQYTRVTNSNSDTNDDTNILAVHLGEYNHQFLSINQTTGNATEIDLRPDNPDTPEREYSKDFDSGRVQIVGFKYKNKDYRIVVDIIQIPSELYIATGNYINRRTLWVQGKPRSITIETKVLNTSSETVSETISEELASVKASVGKAEASKSPLLQAVYDKRKLLKDSVKRFPNKWQTRR